MNTDTDSSADVGISEALEDVGGTVVAPDPSTLFPIALGERLQLVDDPLQWIVERQVSKTPKGRDRGWRQVRFHRDREVLLVWLRSWGAPPDAIAMVAGFPRWHP
jgi:hypothetical protein